MSKIVADIIMLNEDVEDVARVAKTPAWIADKLGQLDPDDLQDVVAELLQNVGIHPVTLLMAGQSPQRVMQRLKTMDPDDLDDVYGLLREHVERKDVLRRIEAGWNSGTSGHTPEQL